MTSRLKRKLNDLGVDTGSSKANESFCLIGTPLPPLEKSKDTGEFVPLWKQDVRDEKGRRRLHGAFTGGFSAGYFNTVGSKEGWAPSTFVSSRNERAKQKAARPEDFMDEEDIAELRESRKLVDEHEEMDFGGTAAEKRKQQAGTAEQDPISAALAASLAPAPKDSMGAQILKKMGWRPGQGIGPRVTLAQRKRQDAGFLDPSKEVDGEEDDIEEAKKHMYPRRDIPVIIAPRKDNFHGLGYSPGLGLNESLGQAARGGEGQAGPSISAGFGLGALNDADDDDVDIYDAGAGSGRSRLAFDDSLGDDDQYISIGSSSRRQPSSREPRVPPGITQTFHDGTPVLRGFVLSGKPVAEDRWFPLPKIPPGWKPDPRRVWEQEKNKENQPASADQTKAESLLPSSHAAWKRSQLSADERGNMLGETPLPAKTRSVFDFMSQKDRERLESIRNLKADPSAPPAPRPPSPDRPPPPPTARGIPHLHPSVAKAALQGFKPFAADAVKQSRYTAFLNSQANHVAGDPVNSVGFGPLPGQSTDEYYKELEDYAKSAAVFKPLSGAMAGRFRSAVIIENGPTVIEGLHQPEPAAEGADDDGEAAEEKAEDPKMGAVRLGMFGPLTREVKPWQPARLLCKRFGVKDPEVDLTGPAGEASEGFEFATTAARNAADAPVGGAGESTPGTAPLMLTSGSGADVGASGRRSGPRNLTNIGLGEDDTQGQEILTYERPAMDVFKAIFASDDEDSDDEPEVAAKAEEKTPAPLDFFGTAEPAAKAKTATPPPAPLPNAPLEKVDLATFKPTFVPRSERESRKGKSSDKKDKKSRDKKKAKTALMSFDVEDDGSIPSFGPPAAKAGRDGEPKKKKRKTREEEDNGDDAMWVEKPAPDVVKNLSLPPALPPDTSEGTPPAGHGNESGPPRGRKRAIDFM
ncbi:uncharacterized protein TRAVEDRAFT_148029 [Trametes versicolor FP-101664 SS1]|uniref:uncharacterized protein n=1 Tax=Trametes versicolor (strain FP-101664) TaxID=717944 RepID=UPI0004623993|nr:uncharacterized protein TRAVEDRAFT_148029 [Trametes versicolor FP-101664 SS1]EIW59856.1 hypothetical protein TRAVEDRAFT_148029 [Trametes versicolor FP-101664 SS1]